MKGILCEASIGLRSSGNLLGCLSCLCWSDCVKEREQKTSVFNICTRRVRGKVSMCGQLDHIVKRSDCLWERAATLRPLPCPPPRAHCYWFQYARI